MRYPVKAVFFDVDGVLLDSLPQHLQICRDKAAEFGLTIEIPTIEAFRRMVNRGVKDERNSLERAVADYEHEFMQKYSPRPFAGVDLMLRKLHIARLPLGLVTSNTQSNVVPALGPSMHCFEKNCLFFYERDGDQKPKSWYLSHGATLVGAPPASCVYVGDQPADAEAARAAGTQFLGVTFGWGIVRDDTRYESVNSIAEIPSKVFGTQMESAARGRQ
jgi:HAD superfamily hydrolase (TIGR01509 family)